MQDEEYLQDADFDDIKRHDIVKKIGNFNPDFNHPKIVQYGEWKPKENQQITSNKYNHNGKMSNDYSFYNKNRAHNYQNYSNMKRKQPIINDLYQSKEKSRGKRETGN